MQNLAISVLSSSYLLPITSTSIVRPKHSILGPILVRNRWTWPTHAHLSQNSWLLHGQGPSVQKRAPPRKHEFQLSSHFLDFISIWVGLCSLYLFYLIHNSVTGSNFEITFISEKHVVEDNVLFTNHLAGKWEIPVEVVECCHSAWGGCGSS